MAVEFSLPAGGAETGTNGHLGGARSRGRKAGAAKDQLVEMRFYIPGTVTKKEKAEDGEEKSEASDAEEQNAATLFYDTLIDKAEIGDVAGDTFATFLDVLHLTPRWVHSDAGTMEGFETNGVAEDASMSICTRTLFVYEERHMTTRFNTSISRNSCFFLSRTICIHLSRLAWIHLFDRVRLDIRF